MRGTGTTRERALRYVTRELTRRRWVRACAHPVFDAVVWAGALLVAVSAVRQLTGNARPSPLPWGTIGVGCLFAIAWGALVGLYRGRYLRGSCDELVAVVTIASGTGLCLLSLTAMVPFAQRVSPDALVGGVVLAVLAMLAGRYVVCAVRLRSRPPAPSATKIIVFGAGEAGAQLIRQLTTQANAAYEPVAILDDDPRKRRLRIHGVPVVGDRTKIAETAGQTGARVIVIAIAGASGSLIREITATAENAGLVPKVVPSVRELLTGGARIDGVRDPRISDLLGRRPVTTDIAAVCEHTAGKRILVTGAGGSIGSELCKQLHRLTSANLIMLDRDESALHSVQLALYGRALLDTDELVLADIRDADRIQHVFERFRPHIVFHAAALKHLPLLEQCPAEALKTNIWGTLTVLQAAASIGVESFVNISTDKAANPESVLGYSKRIAERLTAHMSGQARGVFLSVRFGNVLGSRGSVLVSLSAQAARGGPFTITHPDARRYFMTADEAVQLVLQAAVIGRDGEVLVLDMGEPVRIVDIARRLSAEAGREIDTVFTGLRPGEKLTEDLLGRGETDHRPCHPLIRQVPVPPLHPMQVSLLDPEMDPRELRAALARCAAAPSPTGAAEPWADRCQSVAPGTVTHLTEEAAGRSQT